jgi:uncharacterized membrane protein YhaH (DUF805 family)
VRKSDRPRTPREATGKWLALALALLVQVAFVAVLVLNPKKPNFGEIMTIGVAAFATFALLDTFTPSIAVTARQGAGFGMGANLVGFPRM